MTHRLGRPGQSRREQTLSGDPSSRRGGGEPPGRYRTFPYRTRHDRRTNPRRQSATRHTNSPISGGDGAAAGLFARPAPRVGIPTKRVRGVARRTHPINRRPSRRRYSFSQAVVAHILSSRVLVARTAMGATALAMPWPKRARSAPAQGRRCSVEKWRPDLPPGNGYRPDRRRGTRAIRDVSPLARRSGPPLGDTL